MFEDGRNKMTGAGLTVRKLSKALFMIDHGHDMQEGVR
jgi:hypothetical protein